MPGRLEAAALRHTGELVEIESPACYAGCCTTTSVPLFCASFALADCCTFWNDEQGILVSFFFYFLRFDFLSLFVLGSIGKVIWSRPANLPHDYMSRYVNLLFGTYACVHLYCECIYQIKSCVKLCFLSRSRKIFVRLCIMVEKKKFNITCLSGALGGQKRLYMNAQTPLVYY